MSLLTQASLIVTPNGEKEGRLYSVVPNNSNGDFSVTRATTATRVNAAGLVELVPYNLLQYSEQLNNVVWTAGSSSITPNAATSPIGTLTADRLTADGTNFPHYAFQNSTLSANSYTYSVYVKADTNNFFQIRGFSAFGAPYANFNLSSGVVGTKGAGVTSSISSAGDGWYRCTITFTSLAATSGIGLYIVTNASATPGESNTLTTSVFLWGAQLVEGTSALDYQATETRLNIPRLDYSLGSCPNILLEPQRTNVLLHSADLSQSVWSKPNYSLASTTAIQGLNATRITKNAINNGFYKSTGSINVVNSIGIYAAGIKTLTYLIRKGNTDKVGFLINNVLVGALNAVACEFDFNTQTFTNVSLGLTTSFESPSANVYRISLTINDTGTGNSKAIWIAPIDASNNTIDGGYLDFAFAQWELGAYPTSYIPTTSASVTRNADVISRGNIFTNGLITASGGTWFVDLRNNRALLRDGAASELYLGEDASSFSAGGKQSIAIRNNGGVATTMSFAYWNGSIVSDSYIITPLNPKIAIKFTATTYDLFVNGVKVLSARPISWTLSNVQFLNKLLGTTQYINSMALFPTPLTDGECSMLTSGVYTPALAYAQLGLVSESPACLDSSVNALL